MVLVQKWPFFQLFFKGNIGQENVFHDILERKNDFLGYKIKKFKTSKKLSFFHLGQFMVWGENWSFFYARKDCFVIILDRKGFLDKKTDLLKKSKKSTFSKGLVHGVCLKKMTSFDLWWF